MDELIYSNDGKTIVGIKNKKIQRVKIPSGVIVIGEKALENCFELEAVDIPSSVTIIANNAFDGCSSLLEIDLPKNVTYIGRQAFNCCSSLKIIDMPDSISYIGESAFCGCSLLKKVILPNNIKSIESGCFCSCRSLEYVEMPEGITSIGISAFSCCDRLEDIQIPSSVRNIGDNAFERCIWLSEISIPYGVLEIGKGAFMDCQGLRKVFLPKSLKHIGDDAFGGTSIRHINIPLNVETISCSSLDSSFLEDISVDVNNNYFKSIDSVLYNKKGDTIIKVPFRLKKQYFCISKEVKCIAEYAFMYSLINEIEIPDSVMEINSRAFVNRNLKAIYSNIRDLDIVQIAQDAFSDSSYEQFDLGVDFHHCILYVPSGTRWAYKHHPVFGRFEHIELIE